MYIIFLHEININNFSVKNDPSVNDLKSIDVYPFDYNKLSQTETYPSPTQNGEKDVIVYSQSFDQGWKAYQISNPPAGGQFPIFNWAASIVPFAFGKEIKEHILVNNWSNGWILDNAENKNSKFVIIYWPQYLEYLGLGILAITFVGIALLFKRR